MEAIIVGLSWLVYWLLLEVLHVEAVTAVVLTGVVFIILGVVLWGVPSLRRRS